MSNNAKSRDEPFDREKMIERIRESVKSDRANIGIVLSDPATFSKFIQIKKITEKATVVVYDLITDKPKKEEIEGEFIHVRILSDKKNNRYNWVIVRAVVSDWCLSNYNSMGGVDMVLDTYVISNPPSVVFEDVLSPHLGFFMNKCVIKDTKSFCTEALKLSFNFPMKKVETYSLFVDAIKSWLLSKKIDEHNASLVCYEMNLMRLSRMKINPMDSDKSVKCFDESLWPKVNKVRERFQKIVLQMTNPLMRRSIELAQEMKMMAEQINGTSASSTQPAVKANSKKRPPQSAVKGGASNPPAKKLKSASGSAVATSVPVDSDDSRDVQEIDQTLSDQGIADVDEEDDFENVDVPQHSEAEVVDADGDQGDEDGGD